MASITVNPRSRILQGHDWVYSFDINQSEGELVPGAVITLKDKSGRPIGSAIYNPKSQIVARRFSFNKAELDKAFFVQRLQQAMDYRRNAGIDERLCRVLWSESDSVPGVIVDRYGDHFVVQTLTLAMDQHIEALKEALIEVFSPATITARNDANVRRAEGMEPGKTMLLGETPPPFIVDYQGIKLTVNVWDGQKTGLYLDQLDNYAAVARHAKGRRVLDVFCNQGGFAQACALAGAKEVTALDSSGPALELAKANAKAAGVTMQTVEANAFDWLRAAETAGRKFDLIILDPPSFTKTKGAIKDAMRGYKEIHLRAMKMLAPGGLLATYSCSHHVSTGDFYDCIAESAVDARRRFRLRERASQRADHPVVVGLSETEYLRGYIVELMPVV